MPDFTPPNPLAELAARVTQLEARLARLESGPNAQPASAALVSDAATSPLSTATPAIPSRSAPAAPREDDLEFELGQNWFARGGILALAIAGAFMLALPHAQLPPAVPSTIGAAVAVGLFAASHFLTRSFAVLSSCLRVAAMALLYCSALRLFYFGATPTFSLESYPGRALLLGAVALNLLIGFRRRSAPLLALGLVTGYASALAIGSGWFVFGLLVALAIVAVVATLRQQTPGLLAGAIVLTYVTYVAWAILGGSSRGGPRFVGTPAVAPAVVLVCLLIFALAPLYRPVRNERETPLEILHALGNCVLGYGAFLLHTFASFGPVFAPAHAAASVLLLGLAGLFWHLRRSSMATFFYAMTGYVALSVAVMKWSSPPNVFVWLSLQSILVVATAIWLRSRFIVVANFAIYLGVVAAYLVPQHRETGISIGFGVVALVTARLLNWQQHRLELKTELMRNAYLLSAFAIFPFALSHLVPSRYVALSWVALALAYYGLGQLVRNRKYRWMAHGTLVLTTGYAVLVASRDLDPVYRVLSFLGVGAVLVTVSLLFTRSRRAQPGAT